MLQIPVLNMISNLKSAELEMKMASFRQLRGYYNKACNEKIQKQEKPFPYVNRGIFRKQVSGFGFYKNKIAIKMDAQYNGEDVLMRLLKVYETFICKVCGIWWFDLFESSAIELIEFKKGKIFSFLSKSITKELKASKERLNQLMKLD